MMRHVEPLVRSYALTHPIGQVRVPTQPGWDQILYAKSGLFVATTPHQSWTVPPHRAVCVADDTPVRVATRRPTVMRCLYLRDELEGLPSGNRVVSTTPLFRELVLHAVDRAPMTLDNPYDAALIHVVIGQLSAAPTEPLYLPIPIDERCRALADLIMSSPALSLRQAIDAVPASRRTLERLMVADTGMTLAGWQRRSRILASLDLLTTPATLTEVALACGYATSSSFVAAFRSELGSTPRQLFGEAPTGSPD